MATLTALASGNSSSLCTITDASNAYTNTSSGTYADLSYSSTSGYARFKGFDFSSIPDGSIINSVIYKAKVRTNSEIRRLNVDAYINGTQYASKSRGGAVAVITLDNDGTPSLGNLKASANNNYFNITCSNTSGTYEVYGLEIIVDYTLPTFNITASAGDNGSISPSGNVSVSSGGSQKFTITPNAGYEINVLTVDGSPVTPSTSYTFYNVTTTHSISVTFKQSFDPAFAGAAIKQWYFGGR